MFPLQFGVPGGPELIIVLLVLVVPLAMTYWVYNDATNRGNDKAALWAIGVGVLTLLTFFGGILAFVVYLWDHE